eukprot:1368818-Pleurochrysis_carterae.AAC.1
MEIDAALSLHCRYHTKEACQEPIVTLRGLSWSGVERYFADWPMDRSASSRDTKVWSVTAPEALHRRLLQQKSWHKWSVGCGKLH